MKHITKLAVLAVLGLGVCSTTLAQDGPGGIRGERPAGVGGPRHEGAPRHPVNAVAAVEHLTTAYATITPFDANKDGQIDATEKEAIAKAIVEGAIPAPPHRTPPDGVKPDSDRLLNRLSGMYGQVAPFDANKDGQLDATEQAALKAAIESGEVRPPGGPQGGHPGGGGPGGRPRR